MFASLAGWTRTVLPAKVCTWARQDMRRKQADLRFRIAPDMGAVAPEGSSTTGSDAYLGEGQLGGHLRGRTDIVHAHFLRWP